MNSLFLFEGEKYKEKHCLNADFGRAIVRPPLSEDLKGLLMEYHSSNDWRHYGPWNGVAELRTKIAEIYSEHRHSSIDPDQVVITNGATGALNLYVSYRQVSVIIDIPYFFDYRRFHSKPADGDLASMIESGSYGAYITSNPNNPLGTSMSQQKIDSLDTATLDLDLVIDSAYHGFGIVAQEYVLPDRVWECVSIGKFLGMTDLRIGALIAPIGADMGRLRIEQNNSVIAVSQNEQDRALQKLVHAGEFHDSAMEHLRNMDDYFREATSDLFETLSGGDAGIFFVKYSSRKDSRSIARSLLQDGIYVMPGDDFGSPHHLRICIGGSSESSIDNFVRLAPKHLHS